MTEALPLLWLLLACALDVASNGLLKQSDGFRRRLPGIAALALVMAAFLCLAQAVRGMDLAVAYAAWGGLGIVATALVGRLAFRQRITAQGLAGIGLILVSVVALKLV